MEIDNMNYGDELIIQKQRKLEDENMMKVYEESHRRFLDKMKSQTFHKPPKGWCSDPVIYYTRYGYNPSNEDMWS